MSPIIFNIVLDFVLSKLSTIDVVFEWVGGKLLKNIDFADDNFLFLSYIEELKLMTELVVEETSKVGLIISIWKTEIMKLSLLRIIKHHK